VRRGAALSAPVSGVSTPIEGERKGKEREGEEGRREGGKEGGGREGEKN